MKESKDRRGEGDKKTRTEPLFLMKTLLLVAASLLGGSRQGSRGSEAKKTRRV